MSSLLKSVKEVFAPEPVKREWYEELGDNVCTLCPSLTWEQRIYGTVICIIIGFCLSMGSLFRLVQLLEGNPIPFALMYTIGNIISICATCFLYGPLSQFKQMFATTRLLSTVTYLFFMGLTLFLAFYPKYIPLRLLLLVFAIFFQFIALIWYTLSYIPFARDFVLKFFRETCCDCSFCQSDSVSNSDSTSSWFNSV